MTNITQQIFLFDGLAWKHASTHVFTAIIIRINESIYFVTGLERKHYLVYIISHTKCATNIFVWQSGLKTWFHVDFHHSNYQMLKRTVFFVSCPGLEMFCGVYYPSQVHSKYFVWQSGLKTLFHGDYWLQQYILVA